MKGGWLKDKIERYQLIKLSVLFYKGFETVLELRPMGEEGP